MGPCASPTVLPRWNGIDPGKQYDQVKPLKYISKKLRNREVNYPATAIKTSYIVHRKSYIPLVVVSAFAVYVTVGQFFRSRFSKGDDLTFKVKFLVG
jgi:hypothetical protein